VLALPNAGHDWKTVAFGPNGMWAAVNDSNEVFCASEQVMPRGLFDVLAEVWRLSFVVGYGCHAVVASAS
jgi:hypothetical protein